MSTKEEESLLKSGFQSIIQAFELQGINFNKEKEKYESFISSLQSELELLKEENERLQSDNIAIMQENNQLKSKLGLITSELQTKQDKIQQIKQSVQEDHQYHYPLPRNKNLFNLFNNYTSNITTEQHNSSFNYNTNSANNSILSKKGIDSSYNKIDKFNNIQQRINNLKASTPIPKRQYKKEDVFQGNNNNNQSYYSYRKDNNDTYSSERVMGNKSKQYEMSNKFLNECRLVLTPKLFNQMTSLFQDYREGRRDDKEVAIEVKKILYDNSRLLHLFDIIFQFE